MPRSPRSQRDTAGPIHHTATEPSFAPHDVRVYTAAWTFVCFGGSVTEELGVVVLGGLTAVVSILGYSLQKLMKRCLHEIETTNTELERIRTQLGTPQQAVYRLVAARAAAEPHESRSRIPERPNPA